MHQIFENSTFFLICSGIMGALFGSFATALIYRMPREINWVSKRSACPKCNKALGFLDLFPIFSYLFSGGKCRYCKTKFGNSYLKIEILTLLSFLVIAYCFGPGFKAVILMLLAFLLIVLSAIDFEHYIIPDEINIAIALLGITYNVLTQPTLGNLLYMPLFCLFVSLFLRWFMFFWKKKEGLGLGDVKFFLAAGFFLTPLNFPTFLLLSGVSGIFIALAWKVMKKGEMFPFGPALAASLFFCFAFPKIGEQIADFSNYLL